MTIFCCAKTFNFLTESRLERRFLRYILKCLENVGIIYSKTYLEGLLEKTNIVELNCNKILTRCIYRTT